MKLNRFSQQNRQLGAAAATLALGLFGCAGARNALGIFPEDDRMKPITNPFAEVYSGPKDAANQTITLRTKKGDRSVEVELPATGENVTDFVIPISPAFKDGSRGPASVGPDGAPAVDGNLPDDTYKDRTPTPTDRELMTRMPQGLPENRAQQAEVEKGLGLVPSDEQSQTQTKSYLASLDHVKQLFKFGRYEAALLETDDMLRMYATNPKLFEMKGTLLDRIGQPEMAVDAWSQALRYDPRNLALKQFIERKQQRLNMGR